MDLKDILFDSSRRTADMAVSAIGNNPGIFSYFLDATIRDYGKLSMRAARVVQLAVHRYPELIRPFLKEIITKLPDFKNDGVKRNMAKILTELSADGDEETFGILIEICFKWLSDPAEKAAIKVYAMEILFKISSRYPEIKPELISTIEDQIPRSSVAVKSFGNKILTKLYKQKISKSHCNN